MKKYIIHFVANTVVAVNAVGNKKWEELTEEEREEIIEGAFYKTQGRVGEWYVDEDCEVTVEDY